MRQPQIRLQDFSQAGVQQVLNQLVLHINRAPSVASAVPAPSRGAGAPMVVLGSSPSGGASGPISIADVDGLVAELSRIVALIVGGGSPPATAAALGTVKLSVAPVNPASPVALGANDPVLAGVRSHVHTQSLPSTEWTVRHELGFIPNVDVVDSGGTIHEPAVDHGDAVSPMVSVLTFFYPTSGTARFS